MATTPTERSMNWLRRNGYTPAVVERWIEFPDHNAPKVRGKPPKMIKRRQDLYGFADIIAVHPGAGITLLVQATTRHNANARKMKILAGAEYERQYDNRPDGRKMRKPETAVWPWLRTGHEIVVMGWEDGKAEDHRVHCQFIRFTLDAGGSIAVTPSYI